MNMFDELVEQYHPQTNDELTSAQREVMQKVALAGLNRGGFFEHAAFYGGTCLRIFHGLRRYSEDMDFSLTEKNDKIHIENYFDAIVDEFKMLGMPVEIIKKDKKIFGRVESAFLKEGTEASIFALDEKDKIIAWDSIRSQGTLYPVSLLDGKLMVAGHQFVRIYSIRGDVPELVLDSSQEGESQELTEMFKTFEKGTSIKFKKSYTQTK